MSERKTNKKQSTKSAPNKSTSARKSRGTLVELTGDETDEEIEQIAAEMLVGLGFRKPRGERRLTTTSKGTKEKRRRER